MKKTKKSKKLSANQQRQDITIITAALCLIIGLVVGLTVRSLISTDSGSSSTHDVPASVAGANPEEIEGAKNQIAELYKGQLVEACWQVNHGENLAAGKYELTYRNLRINKYADRAIITDCSDSDTLLAKNQAGQWVKTDVNVQIGNRVNPTWQKECGIEDITVADDQVRPENSSIDATNLAECKRLNQQ